MKRWGAQEHVEWRAVIAVQMGHRAERILRGQRNVMGQRQAYLELYVERFYIAELHTKLSNGEQYLRRDWDSKPRVDAAHRWYPGHNLKLEKGTKRLLLPQQITMHGQTGGGNGPPFIIDYTEEAYAALLRIVAMVQQAEVDILRMVSEKEGVQFLQAAGSHLSAQRLLPRVVTTDGGTEK
jgi:hypothetical protein